MGWVSTDLGVGSQRIFGRPVVRGDRGVVTLPIWGRRGARQNELIHHDSII